MPVTTINAPGDFLSRLQEALATDDRRAVLRMIGLPLRVSFGGEARTYRTRQEVERDYDRIFTPDVRTAVLQMRDNALMIRDGGRLKGNERLWFGCGRRSCSSNDKLSIREVRAER